MLRDAHLEIISFRKLRRWTASIFSFFFQSEPKPGRLFKALPRPTDVWTVLWLNKPFTFGHMNWLWKELVLEEKISMDTLFFFSLSLLAPPLQFPGRDVYLFAGRHAAQHRARRGRDKFLHHVLLSLRRLILFLLVHRCCTLLLLPIRVLCSLSPPLALPQLNNNPSVCKCVWCYFWPL